MCIAMAIANTLNSFRPFYVRDIVNVFTSDNPNASLAYGALWKLTLLCVGGNVFYRLFDLSLVFYEAKVMKDLDSRSFAAIQRQSIKFFEDVSSNALGKCAARFRSSFEIITDILSFELGRDVVVVSVTFVVFCNTMPSIAIAFGIWLVAFAAVTAFFIAWKYPMDTTSAEADSIAGGAMGDSLENHLAVKLFGCERFEQQRFDEVVQDQYKKRIRAWLASNVAMGTQALMMVVAELGLIWLMIRGWEQGVVTIADFVFFQTYVVWILTHLWTVGQAIRKLFTAIAEAQEMANIYSLEPEVQDAPNARPVVISEGHIAIHGISFRYDDGSSERGYVFDGVSIKIPAGQSLGVVGQTGAGKSTLIQLLMRLRDLDSGFISIDLQDIAAVTQESLRQQIAVVPQKPQLFYRSIRDNIALARPDATDEEVWEVAKQAGCLAFIEKLPDGIHTVVGGSGEKLSGGECQRIAIARAILADPKILILDEATSAQDSETESDIQQAIKGLLKMKGSQRTLIAIAHRLSTLMNMDRIIVIHDGKIVEDGAHKELLKQNGLYARLWHRQSGGYIAAE